jgi:hypothetical protein
LLFTFQKGISTRIETVPQWWVFFIYPFLFTLLVGLEHLKRESFFICPLFVAFLKGLKWNESSQSFSDCLLFSPSTTHHSLMYNELGLLYWTLKCWTGLLLPTSYYPPPIYQYLLAKVVAHHHHSLL